ncbi:MAG: secretin and TonB N-terminal domain-containing protein, partial [candidate division Zixibacteria bacterium]
MKSICAILLLSIILIGAHALSDPLTSDKTMSLELESVPMLDVLYMIASQNNLNLVVSGNVAGKVSLRLDNVDITTALEAILTANGYNYFLRDNVV